MSDPDNNAPIDGVTLLISDHRRVSSPWSEARVATERREELIDLVVRELSVHDGIEKQALYPEVRTRVEGGQAMIERGLAEHQKVEEATPRPSRSCPDLAARTCSCSCAKPWITSVTTSPRRNPQSFRPCARA